jgi:hypothetical protein
VAADRNGLNVNCIVRGAEGLVYCRRS